MIKGRERRRDCEEVRQVLFPIAGVDDIAMPGCHIADAAHLRHRHQATHRIRPLLRLQPLRCFFAWIFKSREKVRVGISFQLATLFNAAIV